MPKKIYNDYLPEIERVVPTQEELFASGYKFSAREQELAKKSAYYSKHRKTKVSTKTKEV